MFSIITIASSTTKPVAMVSAISERLSRLKPSRYITPSVPTSESGTDRLGMMVAGMVRRKKKITTTTSTTASASSNSTSATEARMVTVRSVSTPTSTAAGSVDDDARQQRLDAVDHLDDVGAGLALDIEDDRRRRVRPGAELDVLGAVGDVGDVATAAPVAVAVGDDGVGVLCGVLDLVVGVDGRGLRRPVEVSLRRIDVEVADRGAHVVDIEPIGGERLRVELDADRGAVAAG